MRTQEHIRKTRRLWYHKWVKTHREQARADRRKWASENREKKNRLNRLWARSNPDKVRRKNQRWRAANAERNRNNNRLLHQGYKRKVINAYGGHCACCGENTIEFLTLDHKFRNGKSHRKVKGVFYLSLIRRGFPKNEGLRVLCMNCNWGIRLGRTCPHQIANLKIA